MARCNTIPKFRLGAVPPVLGRIVDMVHSGVRVRTRRIGLSPWCRELCAVCPPTLMGTATMGIEIGELAQDLVGQEDWIRVHSRDGCSQAHAGGALTPPSHATAGDGCARVDGGRSLEAPKVVRWPAAPPLPSWLRGTSSMRSVASCAEERQPRRRRARASSGLDQPRRG